MENLKTIMSHKNPDLYEWTPDFDELYYKYDGENVVADYNGKVGKLEEISTLPIFFIKKTHYKTRMEMIVRHMNYFTKAIKWFTILGFTIIIIKERTALWEKGKTHFLLTGLRHMNRWQIFLKKRESPIFCS